MFVQLAPADDAVPVDEKHRALAHAAVLAPHTELPRHRAFRMEIGKQGKGEAAELLGPSPMRIHTVHSEARELIDRRVEPRMVGREGLDLRLSAAGKFPDIES